MSVLSEDNGVRIVRSAGDIPDVELRRVYEEWSRAAGSGLPHPDVLDPLDHCDSARRWVLFDVVDGGKDFMVRFIGTDTVEHIGQEPTGLRSPELAAIVGPAFAERMMMQLREVAKTGNVLLSGPRPSAMPGRAWVTVMSLSLPLSKDGTSVDRILNVAHLDRG